MAAHGRSRKETYRRLRRRCRRCTTTCRRRCARRRRRRLPLPWSCYLHCRCSSHRHRHWAATAAIAVPSPLFRAAATTTSPTTVNLPCHPRFPLPSATPLLNATSSPSPLVSPPQTTPLPDERLPSYFPDFPYPFHFPSRSPPETSSPPSSHLPLPCIPNLPFPTPPLPIHPPLFLRIHATLAKLNQSRREFPLLITRSHSQLHLPSPLPCFLSFPTLPLAIVVSVLPWLLRLNPDIDYFPLSPVILSSLVPLALYGKLNCRSQE